MRGSCRKVVNRAATAVALLAFLAGCEGPVGGEAALLVAAPALDQGPAAGVQALHGRWVGIGRADACGLSWAFDLVQDHERISGRLLREDLQYDLHGTIGANGRMTEIRAGKSAAFNGVPGPRFIMVSLTFGPLRASGHFAVETGGRDACLTAVELRRYAIE